ncbi:hypothetical protein C8R43DRAFT_542989 [Mycena crocata]|nr:hypothetical protein C8R43DRAFT_542989 [Mycena crocata]
MSLDMPDRESIRQLHVMPPPASLRDASQGSGGWKRAPTTIPIPGKGPRTSNPYSRGRTQDTLHSHRGGGNPAAQRTVTAFAGSAPPPTKKPKLDSPSSALRSRKKVTQMPNIEPSRGKHKQGLGRPDDKDVIYVDDQYANEDLGQPFNLKPAFADQEADVLNISRPGASRASTSRTTGFSGTSHAIPDGAHTAMLREQNARLAPKALQLAPEHYFQDDSDDPIEAYPSETASKNEVVKGKIRHFENLDRATTHPTLDLRTVNTRNVKNAMKPKGQKSQIASQTAPSNGHEPSAPKVDNAKFLPIKAWYLGHKHFEEAYHLVWTNNGKVIIRSGKAPGPPARHTEEVDIDMAVERAWFCDPQESYPDKFIVIETFGKFKKPATQKVIGAQYSDFFKQGETHGKGEIIIKFDLSSEAWADNVYKTFVDWFKPRVDNREILRGPAGAKKWEVADRMSQIGQTRTRRESGGDFLFKPLPAKAPAVPGLPLLDSWSPPSPPRVAIANTARVPARRRRGSPSAPIEIDSPPRPHPRPTYKGASDFSDYGGGPESVRRSARQSGVPRKPCADPDEVILVYPPGQTGAVNITNGDVTRLAPGEFLNDTLIEFGLKLWLHELEKENPELVKQIHVFSSFFYKKLNKKNPQEGYESVRKWTSKFDLFQKKYIIIPINENLHWYLAIIYQPEHILRPPPITSSPHTRRKGQQEAEKLEADDTSLSRRHGSSRPPDSKASSVTRRSPSPVEASSSGTLSPNSTTQAEAEVVDELTSCSITEDDPPTHGTPAQPEPSVLADDESLFGDSHMDVDGVEVLETPREQSPSLVQSEGPLNDGEQQAATEDSAGADIMDVDAADDPDVSMASADPLDLFTPPPSAPSISTNDFYTNRNSTKSRGKRKAQSPPLEAFPREEYPLDDEDDTEIVNHGQPSTYVFTLDSLGSRHPKVVKVLGQYLQAEALDKKGIPLEESSKAVGRYAQVPHQPNFCDCGIYLLHLAQTFISDPSRYYNLITAVSKKGNTNSVERQQNWNDEGTKTLRETLERRIAELSIEWKKDRAAKEELKKGQEDIIPDSSDDEVDIVDTTPAPQPKDKTPKTTGKAMRMRG